MAKYYSSTFGKISGKHGNAVAVIRKDGSTYLRLHVPAGNPRTDKQQAHRAKFALTSKSLVSFNPIFKETIGMTNGISTARSYAFKNAIVGEYPNLSMNYEKLMFSFGALEKLHDASHSINEGVMTISWSFRKMRNCNKSDSVSFVVFNKDTNQTIHIKDVAVRSDRGAKIDIDDSWSSDELYSWAYVTKGDKVSDSVFVPHSASDVGCVDTSSCVYFSNNNHINPSKDNQNTSSVQAFATRFIASIITVLFNLLELSKQLVTTIDIDNISNAHSISPFNAVRYEDSAVVGRVFKLRLNATRRAAVATLYGKYQYVYSQSSGLVMRC